MIVNEIAKFENELQRALQVLLVAELGEPFDRRRCAARRLLSRGHPLPLRKGLLLRPSGARAYGRGAAVKAEGSRPASTCSVPCRCSAIIAHRRSPGRGARGSRRSRACCALDHASTSRRVGDVVDQVGHRALRLGRRRHERGRAGRLGEPDVEAHVGAGGRPGSRRAGRPSRRPARSSGSIASRVGALGGEHRDAELDRQPRVAARRASRRAPRRGALVHRRRVGHERAAAAAAHRAQVPALHQRGQRLAQRRAGDPELLAQLALGGQPRARREQAELDRGAEALERLLERRRATGPARRRRVATITAARTPGRAPSRSPRPRRPSSSTRALLR